jgi:hypothetical protein
MADTLMITLHKINIKQHSHITQKVDSCTRCCPRHSPRRCRRRCGCHCDDLLEGQRVFAAQLHACSALASSSISGGGGSSSGGSSISSSSSGGGITTRLYDLQKAFNCNCTEGRYITRHTDAFPRRETQFGIWRKQDQGHTSHVTRYTSYVIRHTSHVTRHTSHVTHHTSHITRHTSHVTRHTSQVTFS